MNEIFIKPQHLNIMQDIFKEHSPHVTVWAYGSRIKDDAHSGSDLDLAITGLENNFDCFHLKETIQESSIPFMVDLFEFFKLPLTFQDEIKRHYVEIFPNFEGICTGQG